MSWKKANRRKPRPRSYESIRDRRYSASVTVHTYQKADGSFGHYVDPKHAKNGLKATFNYNDFGTQILFEYQTTGGVWNAAGHGLVMSYDQRRMVEKAREDARNGLITNLYKNGPGRVSLGLIETLSIRRGVPRIATIEKVVGCKTQDGLGYFFEHDLWSWNNTGEPMVGAIFPERLPVIEFTDVLRSNVRPFVENWVSFLRDESEKPEFSDLVDKPTEFTITSLSLGDGNKTKLTLIPGGKDTA